MYRAHQINVLLCVICLIVTLSGCIENSVASKRIWGETVTFRRASDVQADQFIKLLANPFTPDQKEKIRRNLQTNDSDKLQITEDGWIDFRASNNSPLNGEPLNFTEEQAGEQAKAYLQSLELMPEGEYIISSDLADLSGESEKYQWTIDFYHTFGGVPIFSCDQEGIRVQFTSKGLSAFQYKWSTVVPAEQQEPYESLVMEMEAIDLYCSYVEAGKVVSPPLPVQKVQFQQVYAGETGEDLLKACWVFSDSSEFLLNSIFFTVKDGAVISFQ